MRSNSKVTLIFYSNLNLIYLTKLKKICSILWDCIILRKQHTTTVTNLHIQLYPFALTGTKQIFELQ